MNKKKKKRKAKLHVVESGEQGQQYLDPLKDAGIWNLEELTTKLKKARKKIKKLEAQLEDVNTSYDMLKEQHAGIVKRIDGMDTRTQRMGIALRECMKQLGVARPE